MMRTKKTSAPAAVPGKAVTYRWRAELAAARRDIDAARAIVRSCSAAPGVAAARRAIAEAPR